ncbi:MAG: TRAP transporter small permease [Silicimonas sp.]|nr:TRAP transporter small permease [Silicimonas sp.]
MSDAGTTEQAGKGSGLSLIIKALEMLSMTFLMLMMILTFVDVIGRYILNQPVFGANEMISSLLAVLIFSGLGIANARDDHIVVELLDHRVRRLSPKVYEVVIQSFSVLVMSLIAFVLFELALEAYHQKALTFVLEIPLAWIAGSVSFLAILSVISQIMGIYLKATGKSV